MDQIKIGIKYLKDTADHHTNKQTLCKWIIANPWSILSKTFSSSTLPIVSGNFKKLSILTSKVYRIYLAQLRLDQSQGICGIKNIILLYIAFKNSFCLNFE